jgi:hypothetical protein
LSPRKGVHINPASPTFNFRVSRMLPSCVPDLCVISSLGMRH